MLVRIKQYILRLYRDIFWNEIYDTDNGSKFLEFFKKMRESDNATVERKIKKLKDTLQNLIKFWMETKGEIGEESSSGEEGSDTYSYITSSSEESGEEDSGEEDSGEESSGGEESSSEEESS